MQSTRRLLMITVSLILLIGLLAACAGNGGGAADTPAAEEAPAATEAPAEEAPAEEAAAPAGDMEITMARANWDTGWFQATVFQTLLEELGYTVEVAGDLPPETFYPALAGGDVDMWANGWFPNHDPFLESDVVAGKVEAVGYQVAAGALQGYLIDVASAEEYGITSLADLTDPALAAVFDSDGDGLADLTGCDAGWGCETIINDTLASLELGETVTHVQGTYSLLMADTIARYQRGEPVLFYTWTPNWTVSELAIGEDVVWITVPGSDPSEGIAGCTADPCPMGFAANDIRAVANTEFLTAHPDVRSLLEQVEISLGDIAAQNQLLVDGEDGEDDIAGHAAAWIEENRETVDGWLETARAAAGR